MNTSIKTAANFFMYGGKKKTTQRHQKGFETFYKEAYGIRLYTGA
jgi:hypothetical protein